MNIVFAYNSPPPINGSAMVGKAILDSLRNSDKHNVLSVIDTKLHVSIEDIGFKSPIRKTLCFIKILKSIREKSSKNAALYLTINLNYYGVIKLLLILAISYKKYMRFYIHNHMRIQKKDRIAAFLKKFPKIHPILISKEESKLFNNGIFLPNRSFIEDLYIAKTDYNSLRLLFMSHWFTWKGLDDLLLFIREVKSNGTEVFCKIYGSEGDLSLSDLLIRCENLGVLSNVSINAPIYGHKEKAQALNWANFVFYPSRKDYAPLFLLECSQFGVPVIAYDVGLIAEISENHNTGVVVHTLDEAIIKSLELWNNGLLRVLSTNIRKRYSASYSIAHWHKRVSNLFS